MDSSDASAFVVGRDVSAARLALPFGSLLAAGFTVGAVLMFVWLPLVLAVPVAVLIGYVAVRFGGQTLSVLRLARSTAPLIEVLASGLVAHDVPGSVGVLARSDVVRIVTATTGSADLLSVVARPENLGLPRHWFDRHLLKLNRNRGLGEVTIASTQTREPMESVVSRFRSVWPDVAVEDVGDVSPKSAIETLRSF